MKENPFVPWFALIRPPRGGHLPPRGKDKTSRYSASAPLALISPT